MIKTIYTRIISFMTFAVMLVVASCTSDWQYDMFPVPDPGADQGSEIHREPGKDSRKVLLLYSAGFNSISEYLREDIEDLCTGWIPEDKRSEDVLLVYSHFPASRGQYKKKTNPVLFRIYTSNSGEVVRDTLMIYEETAISASAPQMKTVLEYVNENFPAKSYGMIFSSHATGYLPSGFYGKPGSFVFSEQSEGSGALRTMRMPTPYFEVNSDPDAPAVKSVGQDVNGSTAYEMDLKDFAAAIPMKLDYILFDACLMGGIEVAYELAEKCDKVGFSQAEVLAEGFNYSTLTGHLLGNRPESDPLGVCDDYFQQYDIQSGVYRSATISLIDCNRLEPLAGCCKTLFEKYRTEIDGVRPSDIQRFYRSNHHWFYDLESILIHAGITEEELQDLHDALDMCVLYKGHTPGFMNEFTIDTFSGFSMYLPCNGTNELDKYYQTLKWNKATDLVK